MVAVISDVLGPDGRSYRRGRRRQQREGTETLMFSALIAPRQVVSTVKEFLREGHTTWVSIHEREDGSGWRLIDRDGGKGFRTRADAESAATERLKMSLFGGEIKIWNAELTAVDETRWIDGMVESPTTDALPVELSPWDEDIEVVLCGLVLGELPPADADRVNRHQAAGRSLEAVVLLDKHEQQLLVRTEFLP